MMPQVRLCHSRQGKTEDNSTRSLVAPEITMAIIIPFFNRVELLESTLNSVAELSIPSHVQLDVFAVDDYSTESYCHLVAKYSKVRFIRSTRRKGQSGARNQGLLSSTSQYVIFLDSDDHLSPEYLLKVLPYLTLCQHYFLCLGGELVGTGKELQSFPPFKSAMQASLRESFIFPGSRIQTLSGVVLRRDVLPRLVIFREDRRIAADVTFYLDLFAIGIFPYAVHESIVFKHENDLQLTSRKYAFRRFLLKFKNAKPFMSKRSLTLAFVSTVVHSILLTFRSCRLTLDTRSTLLPHTAKKQIYDCLIRGPRFSQFKISYPRQFEFSKESLTELLGRILSGATNLLKDAEHPRFKTLARGIWQPEFRRDKTALLARCILGCIWLKTEGLPLLTALKDILKSERSIDLYFPMSSKDAYHELGLISFALLHAEPRQVDSILERPLLDKLQIFIGTCPLEGNHWHRIFMATILVRQGFKSFELVIQRELTAILQMADEKDLDFHRNSLAFSLLPESRLAQDPTEKLVSLARGFAPSALAMHHKEKQSIEMGHSTIQPTAYLSYFAWGLKCGIFSDLDISQIKKILTHSWNRFAEQGSAFGSPTFCLHAFAILTLDNDHPIWGSD